MTRLLISYDADSSVTEIASTLREDGGVIVNNLAPHDVLDQVYSELQASSSAEEQQTTDSTIWPDGNRTLGGLVARSRTYSEKLLLNQKILEIADAILLPKKKMALCDPSASAGSDEENTGIAKQPHVEVVENDSGSKQVIYRGFDASTGPNCHHYTLGASLMLELYRGCDNQILHRENSIYQPYIDYIPEMREFIVSVNWAATDFTLDNGATRVVPGSHRWSEDRVAREDEIAQAVMPKGSAVVWLSRVLHGAGKSTETSGRTAYFSSYIADWFRQEENQYITVPPQVAEKLSDRAQQIVGYRSSRRLGWVKGRDENNLLNEGSSSPI